MSSRPPSCRLFLAMAYNYEAAPDPFAHHHHPFYAPPPAFGFYAPPPQQQPAPVQGSGERAGRPRRLGAAGIRRKGLGSAAAGGLGCRQGQALAAVAAPPRRCGAHPAGPDRSP